MQYASISDEWNLPAEPDLGTLSSLPTALALVLEVSDSP